MHYHRIGPPDVCIIVGIYQVLAISEIFFPSEIPPHHVRSYIAIDPAFTENISLKPNRVGKSFTYYQGDFGLLFKAYISLQVILKKHILTEKYFIWLQ